jgi:hypothetical protein
MKHTLCTNEIASDLLSDEYAGWSRNGAEALAEWLEQLEEDTGTEMEFDRVAIRCDFSEYPSALAAVAEYDGLDNKTGNHCEEAALEWLNDHTLTIPFDGGVIIQCF